MSRRAPRRVAAKAVRLPVRDTFTLPNGLSVSIAARGQIPLVSVRLVFRAGSTLDPAGKHGLADFTARLLRRGTAKRTWERLDDDIEFVAATLNAAAAEDYTAVTLTTPARHLDTMLELVGELVAQPSFPQEELDSARRRTLAQLANDLDDPSWVADRALGLAIWGDHPYAHDVGGSAKHVATFTRSDVIDFHRRHYGPNLAMLTVVGAIDPKKAARAVRRTFEGWRAVAEPLPPLPALSQAALRGKVLLLGKPDQTQSQVRLGDVGITRSHPRWLHATVLNTILGGGFTSRLVNEIRVNRGLSYGAGSLFDGLLAAGTFTVSSFTKTASTRELIDVALAEVERARARGVRANELDTAQRYMAGLFPLRFERNESVAATLTELWIYGIEEQRVERYRERILGVTRAEVAAAAKDFLFASTPAVVVVGNAAKVKPQLRGLGPVEVRPMADFE